jgi:hypothetical protein
MTKALQLAGKNVKTSNIERDKQFPQILVARDCPYMSFLPFLAGQIFNFGPNKLLLEFLWKAS